MHEIATGIVHFGPGENAYRYLSSTLDEMGFDRWSCWNGTVHLEAFEQACRNGIGTPQGFIDASLINETLPKEAASHYTKVMEEFFFPMICMGQYRIVANGACRNHITAMQILNRYDRDSLPEWLLPHVRNVLREKQSQVTFVHSSLLDVPSLEYDLVSTSNIFDWVVSETAAKHLDEIAAKFLAPHGYVLVRMGIRSLASVLQATKLLRVCNEVRPEDLAETDKVQVFFQRPEAFAALRHSSVEV